MNTRMGCLAASAASGLLILNACGGGNSGSSKPIASMIQAMPEEPADPVMTPSPDMIQAMPEEPADPVMTPSPDDDTPPTLAAGPYLAGAAAPIVDTDTGQDRYRRHLTGLRHVGADVAPFGALPAAPSHNGVSVSHGPLQDGVGRDQVVAWLEQNADSAKSWGSGFAGLPIHPKLPIVRIVEGASEKHRGYVVRAVQAINAALPSEWQLQIGETATVPASTEAIADGEVLIHLAPRGEWIEHIRQGTPSGSTGTYTPIVAYDGQNHLYLRAGIVSFDPSGIWINPDRGGELDREQNTIGYMVHELIHTLGFIAHPNDLVTALSYNRDLTNYGGNPTHFLHPLDREGLLAAYTRLEFGDTHEDLGPWSDTSIHVRGVLGDVAFGTTVRNGFSQPWAYGPIPHMNLTDNPVLSGLASWSGRMLGLTPEAEVVAGAADLTVQLAPLTGDIDFTGLES